MTLSLNNAYVEPCLQALTALQSIVVKAQAHCEDNQLPAEALTEARLAPDMWPLAKQIFETGHHSARAIAGVRAGVFSPELEPVPSDFTSLLSEINNSISVLQSLSPSELDDIAERDMRFEFGDFRLDFTVQDFLLSFSLQNFFFHVTTAYAILRNQGVNVGKRDYIGPARIKSA